MYKKIVLLTFYILIFGFQLYLFSNMFGSTKTILTSGPVVIEKVSTELPKKKLKLTAVGDCTIGWDTKFGLWNRFDQYLVNNDYSYYLAKVKDVFEDDDITLANFEGTLTDATQKVEKKWNFKAPAEYVNVLTTSSVEVVSISNNHSYDYGEKGYKDTKDTLTKAGIDFFGSKTFLVKEVNGYNVCFMGTHDIYGTNYSLIDEAIKYFEDKNCDLKIATAHWGIEKSYKYETFQTKLGHYMIDKGFDLVIGTHPHVIQGIEEYNGKYIVYSLANFAFGGNQNPNDKDTFIFQIEFEPNKDNKFESKINIIPASVSGVSNKNNYQPVVLEGKEKERVLKKILDLSNIEYEA